MLVVNPHLKLLVILCAMRPNKSHMSNSTVSRCLVFAVSILLTGAIYWFATTTQQDFIVAKRWLSIVFFYLALNYLYGRLFLEVASFWVASIEVKKAPDILIIFVDLMAALVWIAACAGTLGVFF